MNAFTALESQIHFAILKTTIVSSWYIPIKLFSRSGENEPFVEFQNILIDVETVYVVSELHDSHQVFAMEKRISQALFAIPVNQII